jgi:hypothetical protein
MTETKTKTKGVATKVLMPVVAALASAVASYVAKKAPQYLEETVFPKLREAKESAPAPGDVAHDLVERARSVTGGDSSDGAGSQSSSMHELERRRRERAEHRAARQKAS